MAHKCDYWHYHALSGKLPGPEGQKSKFDKGDKMSGAKYILGPMRLPFLVLTPACVLIGVSTAYMAGVQINLFYAVLALAGGVLAHISVNAFNEYFDFKSGLDASTERTPFSGGSGTLPENPEKASYALYTAIITLVLVFIIGLYFTYILRQMGYRALTTGIIGYSHNCGLYPLVDPPTVNMPYCARIRIWTINGYGNSFCAHRGVFMDGIHRFSGTIFPGW